MAYKTFIAAAYSPSSDRRVVGQSFRSAPEAFKAFFAKRTRQQSQDGSIGKGVYRPSIQVDLISGEKQKAVIELGKIDDTPMTVKLSSGPAGDISWALKPFIPGYAVTYDSSKQQYRNLNQTRFDMGQAKNADILIANPASYTSISAKSKVFASGASDVFVELGDGPDVIAGGYGSDWFGGVGRWVLGSKLIVGGSQSDTVYGSGDGDILVGDRMARQEAPLWSANYRPQELIGASSDASFKTHIDLIKAVTDRYSEVSVIQGFEDSAGRYRFESDPRGKTEEAVFLGNDGYQYDKVVSDRYVKIGTRTGRRRDINTWQPRGDLIFGGAGDDVMFGDDSTWGGKNLIEYKKQFADTTEIITPENNWGSYLDSSYQFKTYDKNLKRYIVPQWSKIAKAEERLRLGNDELHGGPGRDVIYGGFGSDLITGGGGFDQIHAPQQILVPDYDPLWNGTTVLYGGDMFNSEGKVLTQAQINTSRFGYVDSPASRVYTQWKAGLTPKPDLFVVGAPLWTETQLKSYASNPFNELKAVAESKINDDTSLLDDSRVVDTAIEVVGYIPLIGDYIGSLLSILGIWLEGPVKEPAPPSISGAADRTVVINDFDIWDTIIFQDSKESASVDLRAKTTQASALSDDVAYDKYGSDGYVTMQRDEESDVFKTKSGSGEVETILRGFTFKTATDHFIESLKQDYAVHPNDSKYQKIRLASDIGVQGKESFRKKGDQANLIDFFNAMKDKWGDTHYFSDTTKQSNKQNAGLFVEVVGHNILSPATRDALRDSGFNAFYNDVQSPIAPLPTPLA